MSKTEKTTKRDTEEKDLFTRLMFAGYVDPEGEVHKEYDFVEMTGEDEEAVSKSENRQNGAKIIATILTRCITRIGSYSKSDMKPAQWRDIIQSLTVFDQDAMVLEIRAKSVGDTLTLKHKCSACKKELTTEILIDEFETLPFSGEFVIPFELSKGVIDKEGNAHKTGEIRFPTGKDREILEPVARKNAGVGKTMMLTRLINYVGTITNITDAMVRNLSIRDRSYLNELLRDNRFGYEFKTDILCPECGEEFEGDLGIANFI